jgi:hypothetical protein
MARGARKTLTTQVKTARVLDQRLNWVKHRNLIR